MAAVSTPNRPPRTPTRTCTTASGRPPLPVGRRPRSLDALTRSSSFSLGAAAGSPRHQRARPQHPERLQAPLQDVDQTPKRITFQRSLSLNEVDSSHITGMKLAVARQREEQEECARLIEDELDQDSPTKPTTANTTSEITYTASDIALRRFMNIVAWGPGMQVIKHNRKRGRVRRVLKFNDEDGYLTWGGTLPPYHKTRVLAIHMLSASRVGNLVSLKIADQGDVGLQCSRLTEAKTLEIGLNGIIKACISTSADEANNRD